jgi:hypothetical protein
MVTCPICLSADRFECEEGGRWGGDKTRFDCEVCGSFLVSGSAQQSVLRPDSDLPRMVRSILSHRNRLLTDSLRNNDDVPVITTYSVEDLINEKAKLPSPSQQSINALRYIAEKVQDNFEPLPSTPPKFQALIGAPNRRYSDMVVRSLGERGLVTYVDASDLKNSKAVVNIDLTPQGWDLAESEIRGQVNSSYGFIALKFGDVTPDFPPSAIRVRP